MMCCDGRLAGPCLVVDVERRGAESVICRVERHHELCDADAQSTLVLGRRNLPSRGLPPPVKRCRVSSPSPADLGVHRGERDDCDKENRRPDGGNVERSRRRHGDCDVISRCAQSPDNHVYQTLEPTVTAAESSCPVYATIDETRDRLSYRLLASASASTSQRQRQHDSATHTTSKRVTFDVSIYPTPHSLWLSFDFCVA